MQTPGKSDGAVASGGRGAAAAGSDLVVDDAKTTWDVELADDAVILDERTTAGFIESDSGTFVFDAGSFSGGTVSSGDVMVVPGIGMGRVTGITEDGGRIAVATSETDLSEIIENGTMSWEAPLDFSSGFVPDESSGGLEVQPASLRRDQRPMQPGEVLFAGLSMIDGQGIHHAVTAQADKEGSMEWTFSGDGNEYLFRLAATRDKIDVVTQVKREVAGEAKLAYTAKGTLNTVTSTGSATYKGGKLSSMSVEQKDLAGKMDLSIAAAGAGTGEIDFKLPGLMFKYIVFVGPVPVTIGITTKVVGNITVSGEASATAKASFDYSGSTGFSYSGSSIESRGKLPGLEMNPDPADAAGMIGTPVDAQFGVAFPRFEISIFDQLLVPYLHTGFTIGSSLSWGPVCKRAYVKTVMETGYDFKVLGVSLFSDDHTLFEQKREGAGDSCPTD
ncbi:MAG: hypothetical protein ABI239_08150 [Aquihabitans sp.]